MAAAGKDMALLYNKPVAGVLSATIFLKI